MTSWLRLPALLVLLLASTACATTLKPVYPSSNIDKGERVDGVRFEADLISFEEPGIPVSTGRLWKKDVARFTADQLNTLIDAPADAPIAVTRVALELAAPGSFQVGAWKEFTVIVSSQLPDGRIVRTEPKTQLIDSNFEYILQQMLLFGGPVLEVSAFVLGIYLFTGGFFNFTQYPWMCGCLLGLAFSGLFLNVAQATMQWLIGVLEERRASDLYQEALIAHAADVRAVLRGEKPPSRLPPALPSIPSATPPADPIRQLPPPPGVLESDPADTVDEVLPPARTPAAPPSPASTPPSTTEQESADTKEAPNKASDTSAPAPSIEDPVGDDPLAPAPDTGERFRY